MEKVATSVEQIEERTTALKTRKLKNKVRTWITGENVNNQRELYKATYMIDSSITLSGYPIEKEKGQEDIINREKAALKMLEAKNKETNLIVKETNIVIKRCIDIVGGIVGLLILIPLTVVIAILNFVNRDNGPLFYHQERIGKDGKMFKMYKFRTMVVGAEEKLQKMLAENEEMRKEWEENRKLKHDPRITPIGEFLRKTSLDEFPQFINVLKGELSLVGPRAVIEDEIDKFGVYKYDVLSVKPGITGYWAANGRSDTTYEERVYMETTYARNWTVWMDIKILFKTVLSVIKKEGAI